MLTRRVPAMLSWLGFLMIHQLVSAAPPTSPFFDLLDAAAIDVYQQLEELGVQRVGVLKFSVRRGGANREYRQCGRLQQSSCSTPSRGVGTGKPTARQSAFDRERRQQDSCQCSRRESPVSARTSQSVRRTV